MRCSGCAAENAPDCRFCSECGTRLVSICPSCRFENAPAAKFCGGCGARLTGAAAPPATQLDTESYTQKPLADIILRSRGALEGERKHYRVGTALLFLGDHISAADHLRKSVARLDHEAGRTLRRFGGLVLAFSASFAAWALAELGEFVEAETVGRMGFDLAVQANHAYSMGVASFGLSHTLLRRGHI